MCDQNAFTSRGKVMTQMIMIIPAKARDWLSGDFTDLVNSDMGFLATPGGRSCSMLYCLYF